MFRLPPAAFRASDFGRSSLSAVVVTSDPGPRTLLLATHLLLLATALYARRAARAREKAVRKMAITPGMSLCYD